MPLCCRGMKPLSRSYLAKAIPTNLMMDLERRYMNMGCVNTSKDAWRN